MRQKLAFALGIALGLALVRLLRGRRVQPPLDRRAEELRLKLAESREAAGGERPLAAAGEPPGDAAEIEEARRRIYEEGRAAVDEMRRGDQPAP